MVKPFNDKRYNWQQRLWLSLYHEEFEKGLLTIPTDIESTVDFVLKDAERTEELYDKDLAVLTKYFKLGLGYAKIASDIGVSVARVSDIKHYALNKLKTGIYANTLKLGLSANKPIEDVLDTPIGETELSNRTKQVLLENNLKYVRDLLDITEDKYKLLKNFGTKSYTEVLLFLVKYNITLSFDTMPNIPNLKRELETSALSSTYKEEIQKDIENSLVFGNRILGLMQERNISMTALAQIMNVPYPRLYQKFNRNQFTERDMLAITKALGYKLTFTIE